MKKNNIKSVLVISAHADDHTSCAGTLLKLKNKGFDLFEVVLTNSEEGRDFRDRTVSMNVKEMRDQELSLASKFLGIKRTFKFDQEDLNLKFSKDLMLQVAGIIRKVKPEVGIVMNCFDWHTDHKEASKIGTEAFKWAATGVRPELGDAWRTPIVLLAEGMLPVLPNVLVDITEFAKQKMELWKLYESQARPQLVNFDEGLMNVRGYHLRRPGSLTAEAFTTDPTSPMVLFDE
jgi:N-acetylglucosamine malate deacetylase 1